MNTTTTPAADEMQTEATEYKYIVPGLPGTYETRHEACGDLAKYGNWETTTVVPIAVDCLTRLHRYPEHLGDKHYGDRDMVATTHGAIRINRESLVRMWNGSEQEVVESHWETKCPVCYTTHKSDDGSEDGRAELIDEVLDCCTAEWVPPSDWVTDCDICGEDHRGRCGCDPPGWRDPFPGVDHDYTCVECDWAGHGEGLSGPNGLCPRCGSGAVMVQEQ